MVGGDDDDDNVDGDDDTAGRPLILVLSVKQTKHRSVIKKNKRKPSVFTNSQ